MPDDEDRPRDASGATGAGGVDGDDPSVTWSTAVAPDDISELTADIKAYRRERRHERRRERLHRIYDRRGAAPVTMAVAALALVAIVLTLLSLTAPGSAGDAATLPLANTLESTGGSGLLPNVPLTAIDQTSLSAVSLRPAVLALVPRSCDCLALLRQTAANAAAEQTQLAVVSPGSDAEAQAYAGQIDDGHTKVYADTGGALSRDLQVGAGLALVVVGRDGTVFSVLRGVTTEDDATFRATLRQMLSAKGATD